MEQPGSKDDLSIPNNRNHGKFTYISCMDPGQLDESVSLNDACKWMLKFKKYMKSCCQYGYTLEQYIDQLDNRLDEYWQSHIGDMEGFESVAEIDAHFKRIFEGVFPLHIRRIAYYMKPKVGKTESRVQVITDCLKEAEQAQAGDITESASAFMIFINIIGSGPAHQKIQDKII